MKVEDIKSFADRYYNAHPDDRRAIREHFESEVLYLIQQCNAFRRLYQSCPSINMTGSTTFELPRRYNEVPDEDLIRLISAYDEVASQYELANAEAKHANARALECAELIVNTAAPLKKRCSPNIPKRYLRASSGNVYEVTADSITKIEIKGGK